MYSLVDATDQYAESVLNFRFSMNSTVYMQNRELSEDVLRQKCLDERCTVREIANEFMCSKAKVSNFLFFHGIKTRRRKDAKLVAPNPDYGESRRGNRLVKNHAEQRVIELKLKLHKTGSFFREIAIRLNELEIPTKLNCKSWHHYVLAEIVKRNLKNSY